MNDYKSVLLTHNERDHKKGEIKHKDYKKGKVLPVQG